MKNIKEHAEFKNKAAKLTLEIFVKHAPKDISEDLWWSCIYLCSGAKYDAEKTLDEQKEQSN